MRRIDNLDRQSLRGFLHMVETEYPDEFLRIRQTVGSRFEMTAIVYELERSNKNPVVILEKINGYQMPVGANVAARCSRMCPTIRDRDIPRSTPASGSTRPWFRLERLRSEPCGPPDSRRSAGRSLPHGATDTLLRDHHVIEAQR